MQVFTACGCEKVDCYRCAVGYVINELGYDPYCDCRRLGKVPCRNPDCGSLKNEWREAFDSADSLSFRLARDRIRKAAYEVSEVIVNRDGQEDELMSVAEARMAGVRDDEISSSIFRQNRLKLEVELLSGNVDDPVSHIALSLFAAEELDAGRTLSREMSAWVSGVLTGKIPRPTPGKKLKGANSGRDQLTCFLIKELTEVFDLKPTSGDPANGTSACNAMEQAFTHLGLEPNSYEHMAKVWKNRRSHLRRSVPPDSTN